MNSAALGKQEGRRAAGAIWNTFLETANAAEIPFTKSAAGHLGADQARALSIEHPQDTQKFIAAFAQAFHVEIDRKIRRFIPARIKAKLHHFCMLVDWIRTQATYHPEEAARYYGLGLVMPGRKKIVTPDALDRMAASAGRGGAREAWKTFLTTPEPLPAKIHWTDEHRQLGAMHAFMRDYDFPDSIPDNTPAFAAVARRWERKWSQAYKKEMQALIRRWIPERTRKMATHICALAERLGLHVLKFTAIPGQRGHEA